MCPNCILLLFIVIFVYCTGTGTKYLSDKKIQLRKPCSQMPAFLVGIAFVVDDVRKGCKLAFKYPKNTGSSLRKTTTEDEDFHALEADGFAKLFRPKVQMCNQLFEIRMNELHCISYPVANTIINDKLERMTAYRGNNTTIDDDDDDDDDDSSTDSREEEHEGNNNHRATVDPPTLFNVVMMIGFPREEKNPVAELNLWREMLTQFTHAICHEQQRCGYISQEIKILLNLQEELEHQRQTCGVTDTLDAENNTSTPGLSLSSSSSSSSSSPLLPSSASSSSATTTTGVSTETGAGADSEASSLLLLSSGRRTNDTSVIDAAIEKSSLAKVLQHLYFELKDDDSRRQIQVDINDWVHFSFTFPPAVGLNVSKPLLSLGKPASSNNNNTRRGSKPASDDQNVVVRPYHTLLLLDGIETILNNIPRDSSPVLRTVICHANALVSFQELHVALSLTWTQIVDCALHLTYWGYGKIITTLTKYSIYQVSPRTFVTEEACLAFERRFRSQRLHDILASFSTSRRLGEYLKKLNAASQRDFIAIVLWLLQHHFLIELHRYVYLMIPASVTESLLRETDSERLLLDNDNDSNADDPLSRLERHYVAHHAVKGPVYHLFRRLCVYFHGQCHLEEIMWREKVTRSELRAVFSAYNGIAICCLHE